MSGFSALSADAIADRFPWEEYDRVCDLGASKGAFLTEVVGRHSHLTGVGLDLPPVESQFRDHVADARLDDRVDFRAGDFFEDSLPDAEVYVLGHVLHNWDEERTRRLLGRVADALPADGTLVVYGMIVDDERRKHAHALLMSLNMLVTMEAGRGYTFAECERWLDDAGFAETRRADLPGPDSMIVAER
ncbi:methyltransferase [Halosimplex salinum]|uniref:methyltransferase n=1 Tax=Halosimplex salinum TaxID=1710538 RepID=UPI000F494FF9|nr:methyltransferase [Halosimplex salinum]